MQLVNSSVSLVSGLDIVEPPYEVWCCLDSARMGGDDQDGNDWDGMRRCNGCYWSLKDGYGMVLKYDICIGNDGGESVNP